MYDVNNLHIVQVSVFSCKWLVYIAVSAKRVNCKIIELQLLRYCWIVQIVLCIQTTKII